MFKLILVTPLGVDHRIFPWGVHSIKDYLQHYLTDIDIHIWDLPRDNGLQSIIERNLPAINELNSLRKRGFHEKFMLINPFMRDLCILCNSGERFIDLCKEDHSIYERRVKDKHLLQLQALKREVESYVEERISRLDRNGEGRSMWAFSVYDATLFNNLYIASIVKRINKEASLVFGGDYFDANSAGELVKKVKWIDGVVIGYGEEVMRRIIEDWQAGAVPAEMQINGLINMRVIANGDAGQTGGDVQGGTFSDSMTQPLSAPLRRTNAAKAMLLPLNYENKPSLSPISYLKYLPDIKTIRILTQRGCGFGQCTFCSQFDRYLRYDINNDYLVNEMRKILKEVARDASAKDTCTIMIDSDANDVENLIPLLNCLKEADVNGLYFKVWFWLRVGQAKKDLAQFLLTIRETNIECYIALGIESLNPKTLKNMHKGITPLHVLEAMKMILDCGGLIRSNYFTFFPLEGIDDVAEEVNIFRKAGHLLCPPKVALSLNCYAANVRDTIYTSQEQYNISVEPVADFWSKKYFSVELPASIFSCHYSLNVPKGVENSIVNSYFNMNYLNSFTGSLSGAVRKANGLVNKIKVGLTTLYAKRKPLFWFSVHIFLQAMIRNFAYWHKVRFFRYLRTQPLRCKVTAGDIIDKSDRNTNAGTTDSDLPNFCLKGRTLIKRFDKPFPFPEIWSIELDDLELKVLRYLYWRRKESDLFTRFSGEISNDKLMEIIEKHVKMGSVLYHMNSYLAVFNDPEYWSAEEYGEHIAKACNLKGVETLL